MRKEEIDLSVRAALRASRGWSRALIGLAVALLLVSTAPAGAAFRDILSHIVSDCLDPDIPAYCTRCPSPVEGRCGAAGGCVKTTEIWLQSPDYVALRDIKMCGCPSGFVHGLALPRARVTGVEDPRRPDGLWAFAWQAARSRIEPMGEIALVVNPARFRTQDQLHVHLVRLAPHARARLAAKNAARTTTLEAVWSVAARRAATAGLSDYGVLVARDDAGTSFLVLVEGASPEALYTDATCR
jgi:CDP-diacylglycerol pyrophosphatase